MHQYGALEETFYFGFAANLTTGAGGDGATPLFDVRLGGAAAGAAPVLSGTPTLLTNAAYLDGSYEVAIPATAANGFAAGNTYLVFTTLTIDSVTPGACIGSFRIAPVPADVRQWLGTAAATPTVAGVPEVDVTHLLGTAWLAPGVAGTPDVNAKQVSGSGPAADNLETAALAYSTTRGLAGTALPAAAADAAGGLIISDAGGLDADAQIVTKINDILTDTGTTLDGRIPAALVSGRMDASVGAMAANVMTAAAAAADLTTELQSGLATAANVAAVETDTQDIQARLPAALTGAGNIKADALALSGDTVAADNAEAFFDGTGYAGTGNVIPTVTTVNGLAAGAVTAAAIATGAVDADALATDAVTEIVAGVAAMVIEGAVTLKQSLQLSNAGAAGKLSGAATTTVLIRDLGDTKNRLSATVDASGNRSAVTPSYD